MKTATFLKNLTDWKGKAKLYKLSEPVEADDSTMVDHVVVSAVVSEYDGMPETYIFPCDSDGEVMNFGELNGSYKGGLNHARALKGAGFKVR